MKAKVTIKYDDSEDSKGYQRQVAWAKGILEQPNVLYPSGKYSHDCAYEVLNEYEDKLLDHMLLVFPSN